MTQKQTTLGERLARAILWLLFVGLPLLYYVAPSGLSALEASGLFDDYQAIYIAGQPLDLPRPSFYWQRLWSLPYAFVLFGKAIGLPVLLASLGSTSLLAIARATHSSGVRRSFADTSWSGLLLRLSGSLSSTCLAFQAPCGARGVSLRRFRRILVPILRVAVAAVTCAGVDYLRAYRRFLSALLPYQSQRY
jgi:hypothetical protein